MNDKERLELELKIAKDKLEQQSFFVTWLESQIRLLEIKEICEEKGK